MGYLFFDTETTGIDPALDQIIEFYGAYADRVTARPHSALKIIDKIGPLRCRLMPGRLPSPKALRVNNIQLAEINRARLSLYEMMALIEARLDNYSRDERLFTSAYNLPFDEKMMRMANFLCLRSPTSLRDQSRQRVAFDTLRLVRAASRLEPDHYQVPTDPKNKSGITFRQGPFARLNGLPFPPEYEHSAQRDVEDGTFAIACMVREKSPDIWDLIVQTADTPMLLSQARKQSEEPYIHINTTGNERTVTYCTILGFRQARPDNKRVSPHVLVFDLSYDPTEALLADSELWDKWYADALAMPPRPSPLKVINLKDDHFFVPQARLANYADLPLPPRLSAPQLAERHRQAKQLPSAAVAPLVERLTADLMIAPPKVGSAIERYMFAGENWPEDTTPLSSFVKKNKRLELARTIGAFHSMQTWEDRATLLPVLKRLSPHAYERALYLVGEHCFPALDYFSGEAERYVEKLHRDLEGEDSPYRTFAQVIAETKQLAHDGSAEDKEFYGQLESELQSMRKAHARFVKTWDKSHVIPPDRVTTFYRGTVTAGDGQLISIKLT